MQKMSSIDRKTGLVVFLLSFFFCSNFKFFIPYLPSFRGFCSRVRLFLGSSLGCFRLLGACGSKRGLAFSFLYLFERFSLYARG